ncbi:MAG: hypothetical protein V7K85_22645 [Nostoc sp.]
MQDYSTAVRWYVRYSLSYRNLEEKLGRKSKLSKVLRKSVAFLIQGDALTMQGDALALQGDALRMHRHTLALPGIAFHLFARN